MLSTTTAIIDGHATAAGRDPDALINSATAKTIAGGVCDMTVWRWIRAGIIPQPLKIRGRNFWRRGDFIAALEAAAERESAS